MRPPLITNAIFGAIQSGTSTQIDLQHQFPQYSKKTIRTAVHRLWRAKLVRSVRGEYPVDPWTYYATGPMPELPVSEQADPIERRQIVRGEGDVPVELLEQCTLRGMVQHQAMTAARDAYERWKNRS